MKRCLLIVLFVLPMPLLAPGQQTVWAEEFENGCATGCYANTYVSGPNGAWTISNTGTNGSCANRWFISCAENGGAPGSCGVGCGNNETLHVGNDVACVSPNGCFFCPLGDCGAAYDAGCPPAICFICCSCNSPQTDQRAESPTIDLTGMASMTLSFNYMEGGQGSTDNATLWYFDGAVWTQLADMPKTPTCVGGQGQWTSYSIALPASANNNPAVRIGFRWVNDNDGSGADPSFAVDDLEITIPFAPPGTGLIVNELSNGPSGTKEYIELLVVGPVCSTVDIRNIKVDDNNGPLYNGFGTTLTGSGLSTGHLRFANVAAWSAVPVGSLILLYNNADRNALIPADDPTDTAPIDGRYIVPANHASIQGCNASPSATAAYSGYFTCTWGAGNWNYMGFRNTGDAGQTRDALGRYFHGISYGSNSNNMNAGGLDLLRISTADHTGRVLFFNTGDYRAAGNFTSATVAGNETPAAPNNAANAAYIAALDCLLPIELVAFEGAALSDRVRLTWTTVSERNNAYFHVERSTNGSHFVLLGTVPGSGDSSIPIHYVFDDAGPNRGVNYYRLRQVDTDGTASLSNTIAVPYGNGEAITAWLDAQGVLHIVGLSEPAYFTLHDPLGRLVMNGTATEDSYREALGPNRLAAPLILTVHQGGGSHSQRLMLR